MLNLFDFVHLKIKYRKCLITVFLFEFLKNLIILCQGLLEHKNVKSSTGKCTVMSRRNAVYILILLSGYESTSRTTGHTSVTISWSRLPTRSPRTVASLFASSRLLLLFLFFSRRVLLRHCTE